MKYSGASLHNPPPPAALQTPWSMTPRKHFKGKTWGLQRELKEKNLIAFPSSRAGQGLSRSAPGNRVILRSGNMQKETQLCHQSQYHRRFGFKRLALAERFNKHILKRCLVKFWIVSVKSWEQPSKKQTCRQRNVSQHFSPASPSPFASACLILLLNFASLCKQSAMRGICSVHKFPAFLSSSRA